MDEKQGVENEHEGVYERTRPNANFEYNAVFRH